MQREVREIGRAAKTAGGGKILAGRPLLGQFFAASGGQERPVRDPPNGHFRRFLPDKRSLLVANGMRAVSPPLEIFILPSLEN